MRKISLLIILAAFTVVPAANAQEKKLKKLSDMTPEEAMAYNEKNLGLAVKGLPLLLPSWAVPLYFGTDLDKEVDKLTTKETKEKKKRQ